MPYDMFFPLPPPQSSTEHISTIPPRQALSLTTLSSFALLRSVVAFVFTLVGLFGRDVPSVASVG